MAQSCLAVTRQLASNVARLCATQTPARLAKFLRIPGMEMKWVQWKAKVARTGLVVASNLGGSAAPRGLARSTKGCSKLLREEMTISLLLLAWARRKRQNQ
jgi:hypothetical protein